MYTNFKIAIDDNVLEYLKKKNKKVITLTINKSGGGCCPTFEVADVDLSEPSNMLIYNKYNIGDITVFVSKIAKVTAPVLRFSLNRTFFLSSIVPSGISLKEHK